MSPRSTRDHPRFCALTALLALFLTLGLVGGSRADTELRKIWSEDFESGHLREWCCRTFSSTDVITLVEGTEAFGKCGLSLRACSPPGPGECGYEIASPDLVQLGLDERRPHRILFRYMIPALPGHWTYALVTRGAVLVIESVDLSRKSARLGWVDEQSLDFHPLTELELGRWYAMELRLVPEPGPATTRFTLFVDGVAVGSGCRELTGPCRGIILRDLPARPTDVIDGREPALCCGSGSWDEFEVWGSFTVDDGGSGVKILPFLPNPFNPATLLRMELPEAMELRVEVFSLDGRRVVTLHDGPHAAGLVRLPWRGLDARGVPVASGVYVARVQAGPTVFSRSMTLVR